VKFDRPLLDGEGAGDAKMVMAYGAQGDLAVLDLDRSPVDLSKQDVGGRIVERRRRRRTPTSMPTAASTARRDRAPERPAAGPRGQGHQGTARASSSCAAPPAWS
jgi:hypothetical protein